jgi:plasmid stability protein
MSMVNVTVSLPDDVASRAAAVAADHGVTVEELASKALEAYLNGEPTRKTSALSFVGLGDAADGFSARHAEERLEAEGFEASRSL